MESGACALDNVGPVTTSARDPKTAQKTQDSLETGDPAGLPKPPWARVQRVQLIRREVREVLSPGAVEVLFDHAEVVVEGGEELGARRAGADRRLFATVMVTIDLARCAPYFREPADEATARRVAELLETEPRVKRRLKELAGRELAQLAEVERGSMSLTVETSVRVEGTAVLVDIDTMATLA